MMKIYRVYNYDYSVGCIGSYEQCLKYCNKAFNVYMINKDYFIARIHEVRP